jgi:hypothetical protein
MPSGAMSPRLVLALSAALLPLVGAAVTAAASGALPAPGPPDPLLQVVDSAGDLIVTSPTGVLAAPVPLQRDRAFRSDLAVTGLAVCSRGETFIVATDEVDSWLGRVSFSTGVETTVGKIPGQVIVGIACDGAGHLFGLTDDSAGASPHSLLRIDTRRADVAVVKALDDHHPAASYHLSGAIAWNPADASLYYSYFDASGHLFVDRLAPRTFRQTPVLTSGTIMALPTAMAFGQGTLWLATFEVLYAMDATDLAGGFSQASYPDLTTQLYDLSTGMTGLLPSRLACAPGPTVACLYNRFKIEVAYDAGLRNGRGPAAVVLDGRLSSGFTFFDPQNVELVVKIVDACSTTGKWRLSAGGMTNSEVSITVTDTATGAVRTYGNAGRQPFRTVIDAAAFNCP